MPIKISDKTVKSIKVKVGGVVKTVKKVIDWNGNTLYEKQSLH